MPDILLTPIGFVSNPVKEPTDENWGSIVSRLTLMPEFARGLQGLVQFSHALVITYLHRATFDAVKHLVRRPRGLESMPSVGIFAQRAKDRPNPIGVTAVRIVTVSDGYVDVRGLDAINGTPILDIKPYFPQYDAAAGAEVPEWVGRLMEKYF